MSEQLEPILPLSEVRRAMKYAGNRSVLAACERFGVPIIDLSRRRKAMRVSDYEKLLSLASAPKERAHDWMRCISDDSQSNPESVRCCLRINAGEYETLRAVEATHSRRNQKYL